MAIPRGLAIKAASMHVAGISQRRIAREIRLSRTSCSQIEARAGKPSVASDGPPELAPRKCAGYYCPGCERTVHLRPCVACAARRMLMATSEAARSSG
jgi:hypothetical protein